MMKNAHRTYDVVIIGAGPAGLSAARTVARLGFRTLVLERLSAAGELAHPCSALIAPVPRQAAHNVSGDLYFRKLDLTIPSALVHGFLRRSWWLSPNGSATEIPLAGRRNHPAASIDKPGLLRYMATQAASAGAELRFGAEVTGLSVQGNRIAGVRTASGEVRCTMVLSAEGATREMCSSVLPFQHMGRPERYGIIVSQQLVAPAVGPAQVGQYITLGRRYTSARSAYGILVAPAPGQLLAYFCLFSDGPNHYTDRSARFYLQEYLDDDPRIRSLCAGATSAGYHVGRTISGSAPARVTTPGFMGVGDAITPAGHLGILPAVYLGRQAALLACEAIEQGDSPARMALYERTVRQYILPELQAENNVIARLSQMSDSELDAYCVSLADPNSGPIFSGHVRGADWRTVGSRGQPLPVQPGFQAYAEALPSSVALALA